MKTLAAFNDFNILCAHGDEKAREQSETLIKKYDPVILTAAHSFLFPRALNREYERFTASAERKVVETFHPLFKACNEETDLLLRSHQKAATLVPEEVAVERIREELKTLGLKELFPLMRTDKQRGDVKLVFAGGFVHACCLDEPMFAYITEQKPLGTSRNPDEKSDLDLFVIGKDLDAKRNLLRKAITLIMKKEGVTMSMYGSVFRFHGLAREVQVIFSEEIDLMNLLCSFDMSHIQCAYSDEEICVTSTWQLFTPFNRSLITSALQSPYRLTKALRRGFLPVYDTRSFSIKNQNFYGDDNNLSDGDHIEFSQQLLWGKTSPDVEEKDLPKSLQPAVFVKEGCSQYRFVETERRKDIPWKNINLSEAIEVSEDIEALTRSFAHYKSMDDTLPISDRHDDSSEARIWSMSLLSCKIIHECAERKDVDGHYLVEGFVRVPSLKSLKDPKLMEMVKEEYLLKEEKLAKSREYWLDIWVRDSKVLFEKIKDLESKEKLDKKEKGLLKTLQSRLKALEENLHRVNTAVNVYAPSRVQNKDIARLYNAKNKLKGELLFADHATEKYVHSIHGMDPLAELIYNHPHEKCFLDKKLSNRSGALIKINSAQVLFPYRKAMVVLCDGFKIDMKRAQELKLSMNMSLVMPNGHKMLVPHNDFVPSTVQYYSHANDNNGEFFDAARIHFSRQGKNFKTVDQFLKELSVAVIKDEGLRSKLAESICTEPKRFRKLPGAKQTYVLSEAYAIKQ